MKEEVLLMMTRAYDCLGEAETLNREDRHGGATNRAYYSIFSAASAILRSKDLYANTHSGLSHTFNLYFAIPNLIAAETNNLLSKSFGLRQTIDYDFSHVATKEEAERSIEYAKEFLLYTETYLRQQGLLNYNFQGKNRRGRRCDSRQCYWSAMAKETLLEPEDQPDSMEMLALSR